MGNRNSHVVKNEAPQPQVFNVRGKRVVLDREVAAYVGMSTGNLNLAVKRNIHLFDEEKRLKLSEDECLIFQFAISNAGNRGGVRKPPYVFTAEGIQVLERVLKREIKIEFGEEVEEVEVLPESSSKGTVVLYQPNENIRIDVRVDNETVWLTQEQMAQLLGTTTQNITIHIGNIYEEKEVEERATCKDFLQVQTEGGREVKRTLMNGSLLRLTIAWIKYMFVSSLVENAKQKIILIDPYIDSSVLTLFTKREPGVNVTIYFDRNKLYNPAAFNQDLALHNKQYPSVSMFHIDKLHDRFLIIDEEVYLFGASLKDLGKKMSGFAIIPFNEQEVLQKIGVKP